MMQRRWMCFEVFCIKISPRIFAYQLKCSYIQIYTNCMWLSMNACTEAQICVNILTLDPTSRTIALHVLTVHDIMQLNAAFCCKGVFFFLHSCIKPACSQVDNNTHHKTWAFVWTIKSCCKNTGYLGWIYSVHFVCLVYFVVNLAIKLELKWNKKGLMWGIRIICCHFFIRHAQTEPFYPSTSVWRHTLIAISIILIHWSQI